MVFAGYGALLKAQLRNATDEPRISQVTLAGIGTGIIASYVLFTAAWLTIVTIFQSLVTSPTELIKIQQQSIRTPTGGTAPTVQEVALDIWRRRGIRGIFRGITATAIRETGYGAYFGVYEGTLMLLSSRKASYDTADDEPVDHTSLHSEAASSKKHHSYPALLLAGGLAGVASWVVTFPFDVVKTRVQSSMVTTAANPYRNTLSTIVNSYRQEGFSVFFHGLKPTLIRYVRAPTTYASCEPCLLLSTSSADFVLLYRAIPVNMVTFATFETIVRALT